MLDIINSGASNWLIIAISYVLAVTLSLCMHEFAHGYAAYKCGDMTPKVQGRLTLNPLRHIDPIGFICCAFLRFGWAKPVPINPSNFRNVKKGLIWTSLAGVLMNLFLGFISCGLLFLINIIPANNVAIEFLEIFFSSMFSLNISLAVFNFLPIYPLDGFRFVETITKYNNNFVNFMYRYGTLVLLGLLFIFGDIISLLITYVQIPIILFWGLII